MMQRDNEPRRSGRPKQPISRAYLLSKSMDAFAELGYAGASMNDIATRVGLRKSSLFHHFSNKEALYLEVLQKAIEDLGTLVLEAGIEQGSFLERLDLLGELVVKYLGQNVNVARLLMREMVEGNRFSQGPVGEQVVAILRTTAVFLEEGMASGDIAKQDPVQLAMSIVGLHLTYFATAELTSKLVGKSVFSDGMIEQRSKAVVEQVRLLCSR